MRAKAHRAFITSIKQIGAKYTIKMYKLINVDGAKVADFLEKYKRIMKVDVKKETIFRLDLEKIKKKEQLPMVTEIIEDINDLIVR